MRREREALLQGDCTPATSGTPSLSRSRVRKFFLKVRAMGSADTWRIADQRVENDEADRFHRIAFAPLRVPQRKHRSVRLLLIKRSKNSGMALVWDTFHLWKCEQQRSTTTCACARLLLARIVAFVSVGRKAGAQTAHILRRLATPVAFFLVSSFLAQRGGNSCVGIGKGEVQGGVSIRVAGPRVGSRAEQHFHHLRAPRRCSKSQGSSTSGVERMNICPCGQEGAAHPDIVAPSFRCGDGPFFPVGRARGKESSSCGAAGSAPKTDRLSSAPKRKPGVKGGSRGVIGLRQRTRRGARTAHVFPSGDGR